MPATLRDHLQKLPRYVNQSPWGVQGGAIVLLLALAVAGIVISSRKSQLPNMISLFPDQPLSQLERQQVEAALVDAGVMEYEIIAGDVRVPPVLRAKSMAAIHAAHAIPGDLHAPTDRVMETSSLLESGALRLQRLHQAREQQARLTIARIDGIENAFVRFDEHQQESLQGERVFTAYIDIKTREGTHLDVSMIRLIQDVVLGFEAGLQRENITITDLHSRQSFRGPLGPQAEQMAETELLRLSFETLWQDRIRRILAFVPDAQVVACCPEFTSDDLGQAAATVGITRLEPSRVTVSIPHSTSNQPSQLNQQILDALAPLFPSVSDAETLAEKVMIHHLPPIHTAEDGIGYARQPWIWGAFIVVMLGFVLMGREFLHRRPARSQFDPSEAERSPQLRVVGGDELDRDEQDASPSIEESRAHPVHRAGPTLDSSPDSLREKLQILVNESPDQAAKALAEWIDRAS